MIIGGGAMPRVFNPISTVEVSFFKCCNIVSWNANLSDNLFRNVNVLASRFIKVPHVTRAVSYSRTVQYGFIHSKPLRQCDTCLAFILIALGTDKFSADLTPSSGNRCMKS